MSRRNTGRAVRARAQRLGLEIDVDPARQGERHHQQRGGEVVGPHRGCTRASKFRLPLSTAAATRACSSIALPIASGSGPLLPMQVVQP